MPPTISVARSDLPSSALSSAAGSMQSVSGSTSRTAAMSPSSISGRKNGTLFMSLPRGRQRVTCAAQQRGVDPGQARNHRAFVEVSVHPLGRGGAEAAAQGGILEQADDVRGGLVEIAWRCEETALPAPHDLAIALDAPGDHRDVR